MKIQSIEHSNTKPFILVVDDEPINRLLLEDLIEERYELELVDSGEACLEAVEKRQPELILLDISMPGMDGFEVCRRLKSSPQTESIPIIFLTAKITVEDERFGLQLGAVDYITKPFTESVLLARIKTHLTLSSTRQMLEQSREVLQKERDYIEYIISSMREDDRYIHRHIETLISPVETSNGDLVLSAVTPNGHRHIMIGDFTGHGLTAAMAGPLVSSLFYTQAEQGVPLEHTAANLNKELFHKLPPEIFLAAIFIDWDLNTNQVWVYNCGMPPVLLYRNQELVAQFASKGLALGILETFTAGEAPHSFNSQKEDVLFAYSDGVQEVCSPDGEQFGDDRIQQVLTELLHNQNSLQLVKLAVEQFADGAEIDDDVTLLKLCLSGY